MGYELHITRADDWTESESSPITLDEWVSCVRNDLQMRLDGFAEAVTTEGARVRIEDPGIAVWTAYSGHGVGGNMAWFSHQQGHIVVKNPDDEIILKMVEIAGRLGARVQGDDGEHYPLSSSPARPRSEPSSGPARPTRPRGSATTRPQQAKSYWWSRLFGK